MSDSKQITSVLKTWAFEEMGFLSNDNLEQLDTIKSIDLEGICLGPLVDVWSYISKHVKSEATVQKITGNLKLNPGTQIEDKKKTLLLNEREKLRLEVAELTKTTEILIESINETRASIHSKEKELVNHQLTFKDMKRSTFLLQNVKNKISNDVKRIKQIIKDLEKNLSSLLPQLESKESNLDRFRIDIEKMSQKMQNSLNELSNEDPNLEAINQSKLDVGSNLATLLDILPHPLFIQLIEEQQKSQISTKIETSGNRQLNDNKLRIHSPPEVQPLQKLLYNLSWYHTQCLFNADNTRNKTEKLKSELSALKVDISEHLKIHLGCDETILNDLVQLIDKEIQLNSRQAAVKVLTENIQRLNGFCLRSEANQAEIEKKITTIERNSRFSDHLSALITTLARKHANNSTVIHTSITRLQGLVNEDVKNSHRVLSECIRVRQSDFNKELELYKQVKPSQFLKTNVDGKAMPIVRLAMNRFLPSTIENLESTLKCLALSRNASVFNVFRVVNDKQMKMQRMCQAVKWHDTRQQEMLDKYGEKWLKNGTVHYDELSKKLKGNWQRQEARLLPVLDSRQKKMEEAAEITKNIQISMNEWYQSTYL